MLELVLSIMQIKYRLKRVQRIIAVFDYILLQVTWNISFNQEGFDTFMIPILVYGFTLLHHMEVINKIAWST